MPAINRSPAQPRPVDIAKDLEKAIANKDAQAVRRVCAKNPEMARTLLAVNKKWGSFQQAWVNSGWGVLAEPKRLDIEENWKNWRALVDALLDSGMSPAPELKRKWCELLLAEPMSVEQVSWFLSRGGLDLTILKEGIEQQDASNLIAPLAGESPEAMVLLQKYVKMGIAGGASVPVGPTDLAAEGLFACAQVLIDQGHPLEQARADDQLRELNPIEAYLANLHPRLFREAIYDNYQKPEHEPLSHAAFTLSPTQADKALRDVHWLVQRGARLDAAESRGGSKGASFALSLLLGAPSSLKTSESPTLIETLMPELLRLGADLNDGSALAWRLAGRLRVAQNPDCASQKDANEERLRWLIGQGLDMELHSGVFFEQTVAGDSGTQWAMVELFESLGASIEVAGKSAHSPVQACVREGHWDDAWAFTRAGATWAYQNLAGECILHQMGPRTDERSNENLEMLMQRPEVLALIEQPMTKTRHQGERPLHRMCRSLNTAGVRQMLAAGANANAQNAKGQTPLHLALSSNEAFAHSQDCMDIVSLLLDHGGDVSVQDETRQTPAQSAVSSAPVCVLDLLFAQRPQDLAANTLLAKKAQKKLRKRGPVGIALAERAVLSMALSRPPESTTLPGHESRSSMVAASNSPGSEIASMHALPVQSPTADTVESVAAKDLEGKKPRVRRRL